MIRLSKLTDYGFVVLTRFADSQSGNWHTARDLADETGLPLPTVRKLLKTLTRGGLLSAHRGAHGGYNLARPAEDISISEIIEVIDGPIGITDCSCENDSLPCGIEANCPTKPHWVQITSLIRKTLDAVTLAELARPVQATAPARSTIAVDHCEGGLCSGAAENCTCHLDKFQSGDKEQ